MSKIQDALKKLQGAKAGPAESGNHAEVEDSIIVAKLVNGDALQSGVPENNPRLHVDNDSLRKAGLIAPEYHEQMLANQYRDIKRPLIANAFGKRTLSIEAGNLIMVCSAMSGEGKTFTSINLALSMAHERDCSVLLVDADVAKPHTSEMFGAAEQSGLLDFLEMPGVPIQSYILPTDVENLSVLPAGKPRNHATELLASSAMESACLTLRQLNKKQLVIFDSPPLLQTTEAKVLASHAGQIVVVVRAEETSQDAVKSALDSLDEDKPINLVLNQVRAGFGDSQYNYGYGYGYSVSREGADSESK